MPSLGSEQPRQNEMLQYHTFEEWEQTHKTLGAVALSEQYNVVITSIPNVDSFNKIDRTIHTDLRATLPGQRWAYGPSSGEVMSAAFNLIECSKEMQGLQAIIMKPMVEDRQKMPHVVEGTQGVTVIYAASLNTGRKPVPATVKCGYFICDSQSQEDSSRARPLVVSTEICTTTHQAWGKILKQSARNAQHSLTHAIVSAYRSGLVSEK